MHEKEIEKLQAEKEKVERQLAQEQHKIQRLENRATYYRKGRSAQAGAPAHHRGAAIESVAPQTKDLSESAFTLLPNRSLRCQTRKGCSRKLSAITQEVTEYRTLSFSCDADQAQRRTIRYCVCRLSLRRKAAQ